VEATITQSQSLALADERGRLLIELRELRREKLDTCPGDIADLADERIRLVEAKGRLSAVEQRLAQVDDALSRLAAGTYGRCDVCGREIAASRLEVVPATTRCTTHAAGRRAAGR
jgi:DnaK suppressor protein